jgi:hypothetical protein
LDKEPRQKIGTKDTQPTRNQDARRKPSSYFGYGRTRQSAFTRLQQLCEKSNPTRRSHFFGQDRFFSKVTIYSDKKMVTSVTSSASLCQSAIDCFTPSDTRKENGLVTPFLSDEEPVSKRKRLSAHPSPTLPRTIVDLEQSMLDVANNGVDESVDEFGKKYGIDDEVDEDHDSDDELDSEDDGEDLVSDETQTGNEVLVTELMSSSTVSNPGFNYLIPVKDFNLFLRNSFSCKLCGAPITETNLVSVRVGCACNVFWKCSNMDCGSHAEILAKRATRRR